MAKKAIKKQKYVVPARDAALITNAVTTVLAGQAKAATKAKGIKRRFKSRKAASKAMRACYKGATGHAKAGSKARKTHNAIGYLLTLAFTKKGKGKKKHNRSSDVNAQAARIVSGHSTQYCRRLITVLQKLLKK
jgi:hypothetical protein